MIGQLLPLERIASALPSLVAALGDNSRDAAAAIMTTDTFAKETAVEFHVGGRIARIGGIAKGSGMIHPNMATMLAFITTDAAISPAMLSEALGMCVALTFNMISVDGDTSTNDAVIVMANGLAENAEIDAAGADFDAFAAALLEICTRLSRSIIRDGEGATKFLECSVTGAANPEAAARIAKHIIGSSLVKCAMFGADANWGRVISAIGSAGAEVDISKVGISFKSANGELPVCENGFGLNFSEETAKSVLSAADILIDVRLGDGEASASALGCDLSYDYVKINGDYRS